MKCLQLRRIKDVASPPSSGIIKVKDVRKSKGSRIDQIMESYEANKLHDF
jgi:hypothetical protein